MWGDNLIKRIHNEMDTQEISPHNPSYEGGTLARSIHYKIYNAAGGNPEKITFFYNYYSIFVEKGLGPGQKYDKSKLSNPFYSGKKYAPRKEGEREPKPFIIPLIKQRSFALGSIAARLLGEEIAGKILNEFETFDEKKKIKRVNMSQTNFWRLYAKAKGSAY